MDVRNVIGDGVARLRHIAHVLCRDIQKLRILVDETCDQPRARDAVDLRPFAGHPPRAAAFRFAVALTTGCLPRAEAAFEEERLTSISAKRLGHALAHLMAMNAAHDHLFGTRQLRAPARYALRIAA